LSYLSVLNFNIESMKKYLTGDEMFPMLAQFANQIHQQIEDLKDIMNTRFDTIEKRLDNHEERLNRIELTMVRKDDFNHLFRALTRVLSEKELLTQAEYRYFLSQTQD